MEIVLAALLVDKAVAEAEAALPEAAALPIAAALPEAAGLPVAAAAAAAAVPEREVAVLTTAIIIILAFNFCN